MLNFAEQTGSGAVIVVWSFLFNNFFALYIAAAYWARPTTHFRLPTQQTFYPHIYLLYSTNKPTNIDLILYLHNTFTYGTSNPKIISNILFIYDMR